MNFGQALILSSVPPFFTLLSAFFVTAASALDKFLLMMLLLFFDQLLDEVFPSDAFQFLPDIIVILPFVPEKEKMLLPLFIL